MKVQEPEKGGACISVAGRDKGRLYLIVKAEGNFLYVSDGKYRPVQTPKRKNRAHVRLLPAFYPQLIERSEQGKDENSNIRAALMQLAASRK